MAEVPTGNGKGSLALSAQRQLASPKDSLRGFLKMIFSQADPELFRSPTPAIDVSAQLAMNFGRCSEAHFRRVSQSETVKPEAIK
jgi:hypothetical protein